MRSNKEGRDANSKVQQGRGQFGPKRRGEIYLFDAEKNSAKQTLEE